MEDRARLIALDFNVDDTPESLAAMLERLRSAWDEPSPVRVDLAQCQYLGPVGVVVLCGLLQHRKLRGGSTDLVPPELPRLRAYCEFSGLIFHFQGGIAPDAGHPMSETLAVSAFDAFDMRPLIAVSNLVRRRMDLGRGAEEVLKTSLSEMMYNVVDHAASPLGGLVSARAFHERREVRVVMGDIGLGVLATLRRTMPWLASDAEALSEAVKGDRSARSRKHNLGQGLTNIDSIVRRNGGQLMLASYGAVYVRRADQVRIATLQTPFPGTLVGIRFKVDNALYDEELDNDDVW